MKARTLLATVLAACITLPVAFLYAGGVSARNWIVEHNAFKTFVSPDGKYRLEYGVTTPDFNWMRLYHRDGNEVIADRRFWGETPYRIDWYADSVNVGAAEESGIDLPPPSWERWTAKLP